MLPIAGLLFVTRLFDWNILMELASEIVNFTANSAVYDLWIGSTVTAECNMKVIARASTGLDSQGPSGTFMNSEY